MTPKDGMRFTSKVEKGPGCWTWIGCIGTHGYGDIRWNGRTDKAHRVSWEIAYGPIQQGMQVLHRCDNRRCVNPDHLFLGTQKDNVADMMAKGRDGHGYAAGDAHPCSRLTSMQVTEIRRRHANGARGAHLAREYGVSPHHICSITKGRAWASIVPERKGTR